MEYLLNIIFFIIIQILNDNKIQSINHEYYKMKKGIEQIFTNINTSYVYHYSLPVDRNDKVEIKIRLNNEYNINDIKLSYIADTSTRPTSKIEDEGKINLEGNIINSFLTIKGSYIVSKPFIYYVSFLLEPKKNIDILYITITRKTTLNPISGSKLLFIIVAAIVFIIIVIYLILKLYNIKKSKKKKSIIIPIKEESLNLYNNDIMKKEIKNEIFDNIDEM